jgi:arylsulfatase
MDIMPTCLELAGASYPSKYKGHKLTPLDGKSLVPVLNGAGHREHDEIFFEHMGGRAVRMGNWKLVALQNEPWRLYDLAKDRTETNDLAAEYPDRVQAMSAEWEKWAVRVGL